LSARAYEVIVLGVINDLLVMLYRSNLKDLSLIVSIHGRHVINDLGILQNWISLKLLVS
jgi:hypothetical protein